MLFHTHKRGRCRFNITPQIYLHKPVNDDDVCLKSNEASDKWPMNTVKVNMHKKILYGILIIECFEGAKAEFPFSFITTDGGTKLFTSLYISQRNKGCWKGTSRFTFQCFGNLTRKPLRYHPWPRTGLHASSPFAEMYSRNKIWAMSCLLGAADQAVTYTSLSCH